MKHLDTIHSVRIFQSLHCEWNLLDLRAGVLPVRVQEHLKRMCETDLASMFQQIYTQSSTRLVYQPGITLEGRVIFTC